MSEAAKRIVEFIGKGGMRVALPAETIDVIVEENDGCTIGTKGDTHRVTTSYDDARTAVWP